jgi:mevalonate kinase
MPAISASAPGKIILFGEHAVVYGQPAIAVPVTQVKAKAIVTPAPGRPSGDIQVSAPEIELDSPIRDLPLDHAIARAVELTLEAVGVAQPPACAIRVSSTIPLAAGLGSGAAVTVAIVRALSAFIGHPLPDEKVNAITFEVEKIHHGTPSGIDNTVVTYAHPVYFIKEQPIQTFMVKEPFTIVIGDTGVPSSTAVAVGDVREGWMAEPDKYNVLFDACGAIARKAKDLIEAGNINTLGPLMNQNHALLVEMGVSSTDLDRLTQAARDAGAMGAKMSGGGRGGNMIALVKAEDAERIAEALVQAGAIHTITTEVGHG